jgi:HAE1 family hydrophobic/amphiphilic exporter-1
VGAREITSAAVAASLAILAIFLPVVFMKGIIGKFFFQFGVTMSVTVLFSLIEALTIAPMRCSQILTTGRETRIGRIMDNFMDSFASSYRTALHWCLDHRWNVIGASLLIFFSSLLLIGGIRKEFVPPQDQSRFMISIQTPLGSSIEQTDGVFRKAEEILLSRPEVNRYMCAVGGFQGGLVNQGTISVTMKDPDTRPAAAPFKRRPTQQQFMAYVREQIKKIPGVNRATVLDLSLAGFSAKRGYPIQFSVQGPDWGSLAQYSQQIMDRMNSSGLVTDVDTDYNLGMPEVGCIPTEKRRRRAA